VTLTAWVVGWKVWGGQKVAIFRDRKLDIFDRRDMGAQNFNFSPIFPQTWGTFRPKFRIFGRTFLRQAKIYGGGANAPLQPQRYFARQNDNWPIAAYRTKSIIQAVIIHWCRCHSVGCLFTSCCVQTDYRPMTCSDLCKNNEPKHARIEWLSNIA